MTGKTAASPSAEPANVELSDATITVPAAYLEDARVALVGEIEIDGTVLRAADAQEDREASARILQRDLRLLEELLHATGDITVTAEHDRVSSPLTGMLDGMVRVLSERLRDVAEYGPIPMGDVLDVAARLRWVAEEAIRIDPSQAKRLRS